MNQTTTPTLHPLQQHVRDLMADVVAQYQTPAPVLNAAQSTFARFQQATRTNANDAAHLLGFQLADLEAQLAQDDFPHFAFLGYCQLNPSALDLLQKNWVLAGQPPSAEEEHQRGLLKGALFTHYLNFSLIGEAHLSEPARILAADEDEHANIFDCLVCLEGLLANIRQGLNLADAIEAGINNEPTATAFHQCHQRLFVELPEADEGDDDEQV